MSKLTPNISRLLLSLGIAVIAGLLSLPATADDVAKAKSRRAALTPADLTDLMERIRAKVEGRLGGFDLHKRPSDKTILQLQGKTTIFGSALYRSTEPKVERKLPLIKTEPIPDTSTHRTFVAGTKAIKKDAQTVAFFISQYPNKHWHAPREWQKWPPRKDLEKTKYSRATKHIGVATGVPYPVPPGLPFKHKPVEKRGTHYSQAIETQGYKGRLDVVHHEGLSTEQFTEGIKQFRAVSVNRDDRLIGFVFIDEPGLKLWIMARAVSGTEPWIPTMQAPEMERLLEMIVDQVRSELPTMTAAPAVETTEKQPEPVVAKPAETPSEGSENETAGAAPTPSGKEPLSDVVWILARVPKHEHALLVIRAKLRAGVIALKEERELLESIRATLSLTAADSPYRKERERWAQEIEARIAELEKEQKALFEEAAKGWDKLRLDLDEIINTRKDDRTVQRNLMRLRSDLEQRQTLSDLELLLAAGKTAELQAKLPDALRNPAIAERAAEIRVSDLLERSKFAEALHASRLGLQKYPQNTIFRLFEQDLEQSFLKAISDRSVDDGARLRRTWDEYVEGAEHNIVWQAFFGGLKRSYHRATGKAAKLEELAKSGFDRAAMEHNGIELMRRLRQQGLSLDEIEKLDQEQLRTLLVKIAPKRGPPSDEVLEDFSVAIAAAFQNPDVQRLRQSGPRPLQLSGSSYYGAEEFEAGWGEWALDCISAKNTLMIFGPAARLGSIPGNLARLAGQLGQGTRAASALESEAAALTVGEWFYSTATAKSLAGAVANSRAGDVLYQARHVLRELRYHDKFLVRAGTAVTGFTTQVAGHWLLMEGAGAVGEKLGGETGRVAGELAAGLVGLPGMGSTARLQARMQRAQAAMQQAKAKAQITEAVLKTLRAPVHEAAETLASQGGQLAASQQRTLQNVLQAADEAAASARTAAATLNNAPLLNATADEAEALAGSARAALDRRGKDALGASQIARRLQSESEQLGRTLKASEQQIGQTVTEAAEHTPGGTLKQQRPPRAPAATPSIMGEPASLPPTPRFDPSVHGTPPPAVGPAPSPTIAELEKAAEAAMRASKFDEAAALLHAASRHADLPPDAGARIRAALQEARNAAKTRQVLANRSAMPHVAGLAKEADMAKLPFDEGQRKVLDGIHKLDDMTLLEGAGKARRIDGIDGRPLAVWKPGTRAGTMDVLAQDGQVAAEVLMSRLGRKLGLNVPYAEPMMVDGHLGVVIRWVPQTTELANLNRGSRALLKNQVAQFKPLHMLLGNYDGHMGNFVLDRAGRVWSLDAGQSFLHSPLDTLGNTLPFPRAYHPLPGRSDAINWTRQLRDFYVQMRRPNYIRMQDLISGADMSRQAVSLRSLPKQAIEELVDEAMVGAPYSRRMQGKVLETLLERQNALPDLLNELWHGALPQ